MTLTESFGHLGLTQATATLKEAHERYKDMARQAHPDAGGSVEAFDKLSSAYAQVKAYLSQPVQCDGCGGKGKRALQHGFSTRWNTCHPCGGTGWVVPTLE